MTIGEWTTAFQSAITPGSDIYPMAIGRDLRSFGVELALLDPTDLFMAHEWLQRLYLRSQPDAHAWLAATAVFGPLFYHQDALVEEVVNTMHLVEDAATGGLDDERISDDSDSDTEVHLVDQIPIRKSNKRKNDSKASSDDASAATAPAGVAVLHQQKITGNNRQHQLRYDLRLFCPPSKDADKTMMAATKKWFTKAKEIDASCVYALGTRTLQAPSCRTLKRYRTRWEPLKHSFTKLARE
jgi:hypothetical protein